MNLSNEGGFLLGMQRHQIRIVSVLVSIFIQRQQRGGCHLHPAVRVSLPPRNPLVEHQLVTIIAAKVLPTLAVMVDERDMDRME